MTTSKRTRNDPRRDATQVALIEAAEAMFADSGVDGVSIRGIGAAIGSANPSIVAYHFGTKEQLIEAVYRNRLPSIERRRAELLAEAAEPDPHHLVRALWQPLFEQVNGEDQHSYARFLAAIFRKGLAHTRGSMEPEFPTSHAMVNQLRDALPAEIQQIWESRLHMMTCMILSALEYIDFRSLGRGEEAQVLFDDAIAMALGAITAR